MKTAILGTGAIGSTLAFQLSRAGHDVTVVARGARLERLQREKAIVRADGARAAVNVLGTLDTGTAYDLVLVTVLATQVDAVLPALAACRARRVMFMFNTFESLDPLRAAVGDARFSVGFPQGIFTLLVDGVIHPQIRPGTTVDHAEVAQCFTQAGVPTVVERDMQSWLRSHAALVAPLMSMGVRVLERGSGLTWSEAADHVRALDAGFSVVRALGHPVLPGYLAALLRLPSSWMTALFWLFSRTQMLVDLGKLGTAEPRMLVDMMQRHAPRLVGPLVAVRP